MFTGKSGKIKALFTPLTLRSDVGLSHSSHRGLTGLRYLLHQVHYHFPYRCMRVSGHFATWN